MEETGKVIIVEEGTTSWPKKGPTKFQPGEVVKVVSKVKNTNMRKSYKSWLGKTVEIVGWKNTWGAGTMWKVKDPATSKLRWIWSPLLNKK